MSEIELEKTLALMRKLYLKYDTSYSCGMLDGIRELMDELGYKCPELDYLDKPGAKIEKK